MKSFQKVLLSLLISIVLAMVFLGVGVLGLFDTLEFVFYESRVQQRTNLELSRALDNLLLFHEDILTRSQSILQNPAFQQAYLINQTSELINQRRQEVQQAFLLSPGLTSLRIFEPDLNRMYYSTRISDILESGTQRVVYRPVDQLSDIEVLRDLVPEDQDYGYILEILPGQDGFYLIRPVFDNLNIFRGTAVFFGSYRPLESRLVQQGVLTLDKNAYFLSPDIFLINVDDATRMVLREQTVGELRSEEGLFGRLILDTDRFVLVSTQSQGFITASLIPERELLLSTGLKAFLVGILWSTSFLLVFLILNLRHDSVVVITDRIKRFQIGLIQEYMESKQDIDLQKWKNELRLRKDDVFGKILKGIPKGKKNRAALEELLESSWEEILEVFGSKKMLTGTSNLDIERIEQAMQRVITSLQNAGVATTGPALQAPGQGSGVSPKAPVKPGTKTRAKTKPAPQPVEVEELEELDELEPVEVEEVLDDGDLDDVQDLEEVEELEDLEETEDLEEAEDLEEVEDLEEIGELEEELDEELDEADELEVAEELEPVEVEEVQDDGDLDDVQDLEEVEELEDLEETEDLEEVEDLEEIGELEEELDEELDEVDELDAAEELEPLEAEDGELIETDESVELIDEVQPLRAAMPSYSEADAVAHHYPLDLGKQELDDAEEVEDLEEIEELEELDGGVQEFLELGAEEVEDLEDLEEELDDADQEVLEEVELDHEPAAELVELSVAGGYLTPVHTRTRELWGKSMDVEDLEPLGEFEEIEELDDLSPVYQAIALPTQGDGHTTVLIENADGVTTIADSLYDSASDESFAPRDDLGESHGIDDLFHLPEVDLGFDTLLPTEDKDVPKPSVYRSKSHGSIGFGSLGFDYDSFAEGFRKDGPGRVKSLVTLSRMVKCRFAALFTLGDRGLFFQAGLGYSGVVDPVSPEDPLVADYLAKGLLTMVTNIQGYHYFLPPHEREMQSLNQLVFLPCNYEGNRGCIVFGPSSELSGVEDFLAALQDAAQDS